MREQNYILLIMNCKKYLKKSLYQKYTWLKNIPSYLKYYHVIGDESMKDEYRFDESTNILWVKTPDDYVSLPNKVITAYNAVYNTFKFKYIFKTDDDQILINPHFFDTINKILQNNKTKIHYGGYTLDIKTPHFSQYHKIHPELPENLPILTTKYCTGRFYFLSNEAIICLLTKRENIAKEYFEDYAIGYHLDSTYKENMINIKTNNYFTDIELSDFPILVKEKKI